MDCKSTKTLVQDYLSGNMDDETCMDFIRHVNTCPSCYEELETYFAINRVLSYLEDGEDDRRTRMEHMIFAVSMTAAEAALVFTVILKYLPSLYELISGGLRWFGGL